MNMNNLNEKIKNINNTKISLCLTKRLIRIKMDNIY